ncbi:MAG TPA: tetratricopeptide repeat protein [Vicinamibacteria bacterium]|nr:tetratricopeptide repeat protein [Vicinamibacteria bacterium]
MRPPPFALAAAALVTASPFLFATSLADAAQETKPPATPPPQEAAPDARQLGVVDGDLSSAGIGEDRSARIQLAIRTGAYDEAEKLLLQEAQARPKSVEVLRLLAGVSLVQNHPMNAAIALKKAEAIAPLDERSRFRLAMAYLALGHRDWARPEVAKLVAGAPTNALYAYWSARLDFDEGQFAAASKGFLHAIELDPAFMKAHDNLGLCYDALGRFEEAARSFEEAIRLDREQKTGSPWPSLNLGLLMSRLDRLDAAEARFREAVAAAPRFGLAHYHLGVTLEKREKTAEAVTELEEAARLDPASAEAQYALARAYRRAQQPEKAEGALRRFEELKAKQDEPRRKNLHEGPQ